MKFPCNLSFELKNIYFWVNNFVWSFSTDFQWFDYVHQSIQNSALNSSYSKLTMPHNHMSTLPSFSQLQEIRFVNLRLCQIKLNFFS